MAAAHILIDVKIFKHCEMKILSSTQEITRSGLKETSCMTYDSET